MEQSFEFFKKECKLQGKHAAMADELCSIQNPGSNYFKRVIDIYILAAIVGFRFDRKAKADNSTTDTKSIFADVVLKEKETLEFILQMMLIMENATTMNNKDSIMKAFRGAQTKEEFDTYEAMFNDYVRGGIEELYESLIVRKMEPGEPYADEKTANMMNFLERIRLKQA